MDKTLMDKLLQNFLISRKTLFKHNKNKMIVRSLPKLRGKGELKRKCKHMMKVKMTTTKLPMEENDTSDFWIILVIYVNIINYYNLNENVIIRECNRNESKMFLLLFHFSLLFWLLIFYVLKIKCLTVILIDVKIEFFSNETIDGYCK